MHAAPVDGAVPVVGAIGWALGRKDGPAYVLGLWGKPRTEPSQPKACAAQITQRKNRDRPSKPQHQTSGAERLNAAEVQRLLLRMMRRQR